MDNKVKLNVLGLSYSQAQTGAYALILSNENDDKRIPVVIGAAEAQSIAIIMEKMITPRPLTHDLFTNFCIGFGVSIVEVFIYRLEEGIFYSEILCKNDKTTLRIDARTSDAVAIALRAECPLYTSAEILEKAGISIADKEFSSGKSESKSSEKSIETSKSSISEKKTSFYESSESQFAGYSISQLKSMIEEAILNEDYERASLLRDEISKREL